MVSSFIEDGLKGVSKVHSEPTSKGYRFLFCPVGQTVKTLPFQGRVTGSIPVQGIAFSMM